MTDNIVIIKPNPKAKFGSWSVAPNTRITLEAPVNRYGVTKTGLTEEEAKTLGEAMNVDLSPKSPYWKEFKVILTSKPEYLDLNIPENMVRYLFLKNACGLVANSKEELKGSTQFYMYNELAEAKKEIEDFDNSLMAHKYLADMSLEEQADFAKLFGYRSGSMNPMVIKKRLKDESDKNPKLFVELYEDKNKTFNILIEDLIQHKVISVKNGAYYFNEDMLGADKSLTIEKLKNPKNQDLLVVLKKQLEDKQFNKPSKSK